MKFTNCRHLIPVATLCLGLTATAQTDSSQFDLGRLKMNKTFTQHITIKGTDLARMPFTSLQEALAAWTYGAYTTPNSFVFVVDGNPIVDIQAISIFDIEEITVVQNAAVQVHGADKRRQLVLVSTNRHRSGTKGIRVSTQSFLVKRDYEKVNPAYDGSTSNFYHQYHLAANGGSGPIEYGISANYLRDVMPTEKVDGLKYEEVPQLDRLRLNAWMGMKLGKQHTLNVQANFAPQNYDLQMGDVNAIAAIKLDRGEREISARVQIQSQLGKKWKNDLSASYFYGRDRYGTSATFDAIIMPPNPPVKQEQVAENKTRSRSLVLRENLTFTQQWGDFTLEPSIDVTARFDKSKSNTYAIQRVGGNLTSTSMSEWEAKGEQYLLTPAVNLFYKNTINLQAGALLNVSDFNGAKLPREYPFVSVSADVARLIAPTGSTSIKLFGSYTRADYFSYPGQSLSDLRTVGPEQVLLTPIYEPGVVPGLVIRDDQFWIWQTGATLGFLNGRIEAAYNFEKRDYNEPMQLTSPGPSFPVYYTIYPDMRSSLHHIRLMGRIADSDQFRWTSGITVTGSKVKIINLNAQNLPNPPMVTTSKPVTSWTGGWVNQLRYKGFLAGVVCMYYFNEQQLKQNGAIFEMTKQNTFLLQHLYAGFKVKVPRLKEVEIYASVRNLAESKKSTMTDFRKFYGMGLNVRL